MTRPLRFAASLAIAAAALVPAGCSFASDSADARASASAVFDRLVAELSALDPAEIRSVEVVPVEAQDCADEGLVQESFAARATLSVRADDAAAAKTLDGLAASLGDGWRPAPGGSGDGRRAWTSGEGVVVVLTDADPVLAITVFPPCAPPA